MVFKANFCFCNVDFSILYSPFTSPSTSPPTSPPTSPSTSSEDNDNNSETDTFQDFIDTVDVSSSLIDNPYAIGYLLGSDMNGIDNYYEQKKVSIATALADDPELCDELLNDLEKQRIEVKATAQSRAEESSQEESPSYTPQDSSDVVGGDEPMDF